MDELHTLAVKVARRIMESGEADEANQALARTLLEALATAQPQAQVPDPPPAAPPAL